MTEDTRAPEDARKEVVGGSVNKAEKALITAAAQALGFRNVSEFVRSVVLDRTHRALGTDRRKAS